MREKTEGTASFDRSTTANTVRNVANASHPLPGDVFRVRFPFVRESVDVPDYDPEGQGFATIISWKPGVRFEDYTGYGDVESVCDGEGFMVLTVVDTFKPGRFPTRVFYTRRWVDPDGKEFGKGKLHVTICSAFTRRATCYQHDYVLRHPSSAQDDTTSPDEKAVSP